MGKVIAITGKGGTGKTTVAALAVRALAERGDGPVLAVDADPNTNLDAALGIKATESVGAIREEALEKVTSLPGGMTRAEFLEYRLRECLVETEKFDLLVMGRPEGPGCYCYANSILRTCVDRLSDSYTYTVMDCEAGLEHISRRTTKDLDLLVILSDPTMRGLETGFRVTELMAALKNTVGETRLLINRSSDSIPLALESAAQQRGIEIWGTIPEDEEIKRLDGEGKPLIEVSAENPVFAAVKKVLDSSL
ncbi:MAG: AAA family ATPase [Armatimonadetes bacterium]|nr:AAA family ATPase [Armatimonadota bacterium]NIM23562.1 AAA family ATPase [Armatimonadota bacterium]NIM67428.1 AAA family ATPase [Armatimonadota bacterium]NIM75929.1 AAA family ATPase [Armatimonadota bacterium]NIN05614.1 AAA family ATPase [Armatimonadota bacterium]